jgi:hypothetical protein
MSLTTNDLKRDDLGKMDWLGVVVNAEDPTFQYRCQVKIFGKFDELDNADLPWCNPRNPAVFGTNGGSGAGSYPKVGTVVQVRFNNGDKYAPEYESIQELSADVIEEIKNSYENSQVIVFDKEEKLKIWYTRAKGITIELDESRANIASDNTITIEHKGTTSMIELKGSTVTINADSEINITGTSRVKIDSAEVWANGKETKIGHIPAYSAVLAEPLWAFLRVLASTVDAKLYPTPGAMTQAAAMAEQLSTSNTVKVSK